MVKKPKGINRLIPAIAGGLFGLSIIAFLGFYAGLRPSLSQGYFIMTVLPAVGFTLIALTLLLWIRQHHPQRNAVVSLGAMGITMLLSLGVVSLLSSETVDLANQWTRHSFAVRDKLHRISLDVLQLNDAQRNEERFLHSSLNPPQKITANEHVKELVIMVADHPFQSEQANRLLKLIETRQGRGLDQSSRLAIPGSAFFYKSEKSRAAIHDVIAAMLKEEERLLQERSQKQKLPRNKCGSCPLPEG